MAKKGGGAWKVAYADFVTAMMAFFLVMWICAQDQKVRQAVAHYFTDPIHNTIDPMGASRKPGNTGSVFKSLSDGSVPKRESVALGRGRATYTTDGEHSVATRIVGDWLQTNGDLLKRWRARAARAREAAAWSKEVQEGAGAVEESATLLLAEQLKDEFTKSAPLRDNGVYQDLLHVALADVNWQELASDLLKAEPPPRPAPRQGERTN